MEPKKHESLDLERKRPLFFNIGLAISLGLTIVAFNWKAPYDPIDLTEPKDIFEPTYIIPATKISQPEPPKPKVEKKEVKKSLQPPIIIESEVVDKLMEEPVIDMETDLTELIESDPGMPEEIIETTFEIVETMPEFPGGIEAFYKYIGNNMDYPSAARRMGIEGRVFVQFVIDKDGNVTEATAVRGIGAGCDEEAVRVLENAPKWNPGKQRGRAVKVRMIVPINFSLN